MQPRDIKTFLLLEAIGEDKSISQRDLARKLKISLGLVNLVINKLLIEGLFKTSKRSNNRIRYSLNPKGITKKTELSRKYFSYLMGYYKEMKKRISDFLAELSKSGKRKIILYGADELCEIVCIVIGDNHLCEVEIIDDNKAGRRLCGIAVSETNIIKTSNYDAIILLNVENASYYYNELVNRGVPSNKIFSII